MKLISTTGTENAVNARKWICLSPVLHKLLWVFLLGLTAAIILWPVSPSPYDPLPIQSIYAVQNLPWFIALFYVWTVVLAALLFLVKGSTLERLALCLVFMLVFVQFWALASPWGTSWDSTSMMAQVRYLSEKGSIPLGGHPNFRYLDFPGLQLTGLALWETTSADIFMATRIFLLVSGVSFMLILYVVFLELMRTPYRAALAAILAVAGSLSLSTLSNAFHPINVATIYIGIFFLLLIKSTRGAGQDWRDHALFILLAIAATVGYLFTPVFFAMVLLSAYVLYRMAKAPGYISPPMIFLILVIYISWQLYLTVFSFSSNVIGAWTSIEAFRGDNAFRTVFQALRANLGPTYPWWGTVSRLFWWLSVFGFGSLLLLWRLFRFRKADSLGRVQLVFFAGTLLTVLIGGSISPGVMHGGLQRYEWLAPLVLAPALVEILSRPRARPFAIAFSLAGLSLLLPTFLANNDSISQGRTYVSDIAATQFMASQYGNGEHLLVYTNGPSVDTPRLYLAEARLIAGVDVWGATKEDLKKAIPSLVNAFAAGTPEFSGSNTVFYSSRKARSGYHEWFGVPPDDPLWNRMEEGLAKTSRIYDVGSLQLYVP